MCEPTAVGRQPHAHPHREISENGGPHMSHMNSTANRRRTGVGVGIAVGAAFGAALLSLGTSPEASADSSSVGAGTDEAAAFAAAASAVATLAGPAAGTGTIDDPFVNPYDEPNGYTDLFGAMGGTGDAHHNLDLQLLAQDPGSAEAFDLSVEQFQEGNTHPLAGLINAIDSSAYYVQISPDIDGTIDVAGPIDGYLVPQDVLGY